ncbi:N-acetylmuramic acid 6-phosphate etherase [Nonomuraea rubra]|uniref:N-acetylmuramic acid 6-phosphate etherase n=1 Tax=Nonomuraea rubra TaxID=46180 RepID=UPI0031F0756D
MIDPLPELSTEQSDPRYSQIDRLPTERIARLMNQADAAVPAAVAVVIPAISAAIDAIADRMAAGGRLFYVGAGTSGRLAVLDASECPPTFGTDPSLVQGVIAGGPDALTRSVEGAEDDAEAGAAALKDLEVGPLDSVVGVSASGRAPFVLGALAEAASAGALTVGLSCNDDAPLSAAAEHAIEVVVGPEVVTGSTRLKAGTAQKLVLNMISTISMVKLGRTYGKHDDRDVGHEQQARGAGHAHRRRHHRRRPRDRGSGAGRGRWPGEGRRADDPARPRRRRRPRAAGVARRAPERRAERLRRATGQ